MDKNISNDSPSSSELEWISLATELHKEGNMVQETDQGKLLRKLKTNPLIPLGCLATTAVLGAGLYNFFKGNAAKSQKMMRLRVLAQGSTVAGIILTVFLASGNSK